MSDKELRELNAWIAERMMEVKCAHEWQRISKRKCKCLKCGYIQWNGSANSCADYTIDPAAAMQVLEKCAEKCTVQITKECGPYPIINSLVSGSGLGEEAPTLPLAICLFAKQLFSNENNPIRVDQ